MAGSTDIHTLVIVSSSCTEIVAKETNMTDITEINNMYCSKQTDSFVVTTGTCVTTVFMFYMYLPVLLV